MTHHLTLATIGLYLLACLFLDGQTFFSSDTGLRFTQIVNLSATGGTDFAIPYSYQELDPDLHHLPYYYAYTVVDGRIYFSISPIFPWLVSWLWAGLGRWSLPILPVLGGVASAWAVYLLDPRRDRRLFWLSLIATPLLFYSLTLWDHTVGVALAVGGLTLLAHGRNGWAGLLLALAVGFRVELALFALVVTLSAWWVGRPVDQLILGGAMGGIMVGMFNGWAYGHPLGPVMAAKLTGFGRVEQYAFPVRETTALTERILMLFPVTATQLIEGIALLFVLTGLLLSLICLRNRTSLVPHTLGWFNISTAGLLFGYILLVQADLLTALYGLLPTATMLLLAVGYQPPQHADRYRLVYTATFGFVGLMLLIWPRYGGLQFGARYLLVAYPLMLWLAWVRVVNMGRAELRGTLFALLMAGVLLQGGAVYQLHLMHEAQQAIQIPPAEVVLTNHPYLGSQMPALSVLYVDNNQDLRDLCQKLAQNNVVLAVWAEVLVEFPIDEDVCATRKP